MAAYAWVATKNLPDGVNAVSNSIFWRLNMVTVLQPSGSNAIVLAPFATAATVIGNVIVSSIQAMMVVDIFWKFVINDAIVVWRAWAVARHRRVVRIILVVLLLITASKKYSLLYYGLGYVLTVSCQVCVVADAAFFAIYDHHKPAFDSLEEILPPIVFQSPAFFLLIYVPSIFTNLISTLTIFRTTW